MTPISNVPLYNERMAKGLMDKLFFIDKVDADIFVDYGCADGSVIGWIHDNMPNKTVVGYDNDRYMADIAKNNHPGVFISTNFDDIRDNIKLIKTNLPNLKTALILSSVIHEVYSYAQSYVDIVEFWDRVFRTGFDYIIIRDMSFNPTESFNRSEAIRPLIKKVLSKADKTLVASYEKVWGPIYNDWGLAHFLLKYKYTNNWEREVLENYFSLPTKELLHIPKLYGKGRGYKTLYKETFTLPYLKKIVKEDFDIDLKLKTHIKLIWEKKR